MKKKVYVVVRILNNIVIRKEQGIDRIDLLKNDTQGFEMEVFKGAEQSMKDNKIGLIYFEVIFSDMYKRVAFIRRTF